MARQCNRLRFRRNSLFRLLQVQADTTEVAAHAGQPAQRFGAFGRVADVDLAARDRAVMVPVLPQSWVTGEAFHLIWSDSTTLSEPAHRVRDWIIEEARAAALVRLP